MNRNILLFTILAMLITTSTAKAQQTNSTQRDIWRTIEARWNAWEAGDLRKMLQYYHPAFHTWNFRTGLLDGRDSMIARWNRKLDSEEILAVTVHPIKLELLGNFAAAYYVSREKVAFFKERTPQLKVDTITPSTVVIRWSEYLVRRNGRWESVGYSGSACSDKEPPQSVCRAHGKQPH